jgi:2-amino-4-hydroxy-6-hydroxymethyldihydropteridine diphosphokinase
MAQCLIGLGSNLGDSDATILAAWQGIGQFPDTQTLKLSSVVTTQPAGGPVGQSPFRNAVGLIQTSLVPEHLLRQLLELEEALGRVREHRWGPRSIDLDVLLYECVELATANLILPHPRMAFRRFVLEPAVQIAPDFVYPTNGWSIKQLLEHLNLAKQALLVVSLDPKVASDAIRLVADRIELAAEGWTILGETTIEAGSASTPLTRRFKLIVIVDLSGDDSMAANLQRNTWRTMIRRQDVGPVLWLNTASADVVADEVVAAIAAMR